MTTIEVTKTELVWPGKYNEDGTLREVPRVSLPFQVIETVNESRATREAKITRGGGSLFDFWEGSEGDTFEDGWKNKLIWGDNLLVMGSLLEKFAGKIDLIYIDPPFATGADFSFHAEVGNSGDELRKEHSALEEKAYRDTWGSGIDSYLKMMSQRLVVMRELLSDKGSIYLHCDPTASHYLKAIMDETFGTQNFRNEIAWCYKGMPSSAKKFQQKHDIILFYCKSEAAKEKFIVLTTDPDPGSLKTYESAQRVGYNANHKRNMVTVFDREKYEKAVAEGKIPSGMYEKEWDGGRPPMRDWWDDIKILGGPRNKEKSGYPTQKPLALTERIIRASSNEGDLVADFFCGSGTTLVSAEKLGRRWIGCDLGRYGVHVSRKRMLDIKGCQPFEVLNLGKYERQYWQDVTFGEEDRPQSEQSIFEYLAFILRLYSAQPLPGTQHLHGKRGGVMVHIGAVDAPVTFDEVEEALNECAQLKQSELHILGWEWEMGLAGPNNEVRRGGLMHEAAKVKGIKLLLLQIPREVMEQQAVDQGDIRFFELAYLKASVKETSRLSVQIALKDFVIPNYELISEDVREKVSKWSDYIDYWAVDWNFQSDTFMQGWVTYRTRKDRSLKLESDIHTYTEPGRYTVLLKVVDIFGNDTSQAIEVEVN